VRVLEGDVSLADLHAGVTPGHSREYNTQQHKEDMMKLRKMAFGSQEYVGSSQSAREMEMRTVKDSVEVHKA